MNDLYAPPVHLNVISSQGGLGDQIARIPAYKYMLETHPHVSATVWAQDYFVELGLYLYKHPRLIWRRLSEAGWAMPKPVIEFDPDRVTSLNLHLTTQAFLMLMDMVPPSPEASWYPRARPVKDAVGFFMKKKIRQAPEGCVVFTVAHTAPTREWLPIHINELARRVRAAGLTPVLLGSTKKIDIGVANDGIQGHVSNGIDKSLFLDLLDQTTIIEALGIIQRAACVVGVDNGLLHLASCTNVPIVCGYTSLKAVHREPIRPEGKTINLEAEVPCGGCQSNGFAVNHDWRRCRNTERPYICLLTMSSDRFWEALKSLKVV